MTETLTRDPERSGSSRAFLKTRSSTSSASCSRRLGSAVRRELPPAIRTIRWEFLVGDKPPLALGPARPFAVTALLVDEGVNAWWLLPVAVLALRSAGVITAARTTQPRWTGFPQALRDLTDDPRVTSHKHSGRPWPATSLSPQCSQLFSELVVCTAAEPLDLCVTSAISDGSRHGSGGQERPLGVHRRRASARST
jgi:hypothetical protein